MIKTILGYRHSFTLIKGTECSDRKVRMFVGVDSMASLRVVGDVFLLFRLLNNWLNTKRTHQKDFELNINSNI